MTPRQAAALHLPELDRTFDRLKATFGPGTRLELLETPAGTWGRDPTAGWPRVRGDEFAAEPWQPGK